MVNRIDHRFLDGGLGEVPEPLRLRTLRVLDDRFLEVVPLDEIDGIAGDPAQRILENLLFKPISARAFGKPHHVDLGDREKALEVLVGVKHSKPNGLASFSAGLAECNEAYPRYW